MKRFVFVLLCLALSYSSKGQEFACVKEVIKIVFPVGATGLVCVTYPDPFGKVVSCMGLIASLDYAVKNSNRVVDACGWDVVEKQSNEATVELNGSEDEVNRMKNSLKASGCSLDSRKKERCND